MTDTVPRPTLLLQITVDAACMLDLRRLVVRHCGSMLSFMRMQPIKHATKMVVWLRITESAKRALMDAAVMRSLPSAQFGRLVQS
ncbi:hypothetical protein [Pseudoduganella lutea]|uniref:Uncharacterized protein n=1 Tax=Pseudoduganella lutea TaxID=321985 RepID=A0A4P6KYW9_9BURK|nr:hypothetical protein [Pseudoduganella lutea]QBE64429.1 hypothetical protein EWM63_16730 [Pseudoduganella lutea]